VKSFTKIGWDWRDRPDLDSLRAALEPLGIYVHEDPASEGSYWRGYVFSKLPMTRAALEELVNE
jgi:hypothetical protein